ncbi:hypothetical protein [Nocardia sputi]|uniref:hypothetical protein n=1 Tax=Nocardia sputi TaxID=2943705 RepID=UPI0020BE3558|nr:hypothetical protein [Nocardia sputi]
MASSIESIVHARAGMRQRLLHRDARRVLIARLDGSLEAVDSYTRVNCAGYGRIRRFNSFGIHLRSTPDAPRPKPLYRGLPPVLPYTTQVFQLGGCNWACWYCFVDDALLSGDQSLGRFMTAAELVDLYLAEADPPPVLDLSGGQPDLVPEWCLWMMRELDERGLRGHVHIWIDDNLSGHWMRQVLTAEDIAYMAAFPQHSRVGCFKGFDEASFVDNTGAPASSFHRQFSILAELLTAGFDVYAYATFTARPMPDRHIPSAMKAFVDRLQAIHTNLPLRTIPLEIRPYTAISSRVAPTDAQPFYRLQYQAAAAWEHELQTRFTEDQRQTPYEDIPLR